LIYERRAYENLADLSGGYPATFWSFKYDLKFIRKRAALLLINSTR
jgi:hypothetical protein